MTSSLNISPGLPRMSPEQFVAKWRGVEFGEKQASQEMFLDICALAGHPTPVDYGTKRYSLLKSGCPAVSQTPIWKAHAAVGLKPGAGGEVGTTSGGMLALPGFSLINFDGLSKPGTLLIEKSRTLWVDTLTQARPFEWPRQMRRPTEYVKCPRPRSISKSNNSVREQQTVS